MQMRPGFVTVRIVPREVGAHAGRDGSFKIMTANGSDVVYAAAHGGGRLVQDSTEIASYRVWFDLIGDVALPKAIGVRDSKAVDAGQLSLSAGSFADLVARVKRDELTL
ncbi:Scr1 family TA system antitoxin-like transcriptional regulator [Spirillospora sp. NPDC048911]|uniref:DUF397 domain-containing protein n=1 Tax=Spirillospora sp. NPDC048911 TaxID=3364527 RepID=UPI00371A7ED9